MENTSLDSTELRSGLHFAPPCGSFSLARRGKRKHGNDRGWPRAVRSRKCPHGLPDLTPKDPEWVWLVNVLCLACSFGTFGRSERAF